MNDAVKNNFLQLLQPGPANVRTDNHMDRYTFCNEKDPSENRGRL